MKKKGVFKTDILFYDDLRKMKTWEQARSAYIHQIGKHRTANEEESLKKAA